jgi:hypothetical protein
MVAARPTAPAGLLPGVDVGRGNHRRDFVQAAERQYGRVGPRAIPVTGHHQG